MHNGDISYYHSQGSTVGGTADQEVWSEQYLPRKFAHCLRSDTATATSASKLAHQLPFIPLGLDNSRDPVGLRLQGHPCP